MSRNSQIRYRENHPTVTMTCKNKQQYANIVEQAKQLNLSISDYLKKVILSDINSFDEGKRIGYKECNGECQAIIDADFVSKEDATKERKESYNKGYWKGVKEVTKEIEEKDNLNTNLNNKNIGLNNDNTALRETNADLREHIDKYLDDAGRREKLACIEEQNKLEQKRYDFDSACERGQNKLEQERYDFEQSVIRIDNCLTERELELDQLDKYQNQRNEEQDERDKKLSELQKLINDQADKWRIERKKITQEQDRIQKLIDDKAVKWQIKDSELKQKKYELEQEKDAIAAVKKDLMDFAREIGQELSELSRIEQKIERNKHFLFLTGEHEKVLERTIRANFP